MPAATATNFNIAKIHQGPGNLWIVGGGVPDSAAPQLTLTGGTPDSIAYPLSLHLGATAAANTITVKPKVEDIKIDQADTAVARYLTELDMSIEADLSQFDPTIMANALPYGTFSTVVSPGYNQLTFGGLLGAGMGAPLCIALITPKRATPTLYIVTILFNAQGTIGLSAAIGRAKATNWKATFAGLADITRGAGRQTGVVYETT
jgi:hypothetical protein